MRADTIGAVATPHIPAGRFPGVEGEAMPAIRTKIETCPGDGSETRWAQSGDWAIRFYPAYGGVEGFQRLGRRGWYLDAHQEMPPGAYQALAKAIGAPLDV